MLNHLPSKSSDGPRPIVLEAATGPLQFKPGDFDRQLDILKAQKTFRYFRGQKLNPNFFFSNFSGASGISRQNPGISRPKSLISLVSEVRIELFGPHPFTWKTPTPLENIQTKKFGFGFLFRARYLWRFCSLLFVVFPWLFRGPLLFRKTVFGPFSWLFRGPRFGQNLRVLALEQSSD